MKQDRAIILRTIKCGEADLVVHALNRKGNRIHLWAKGALRSRRRFGGGVLEPFHYMQFVYRPSRQEPVDGLPLHWLEEAQLLREFAGLRTDWERLELGIHLLQLVLRVSHEGGVDNSSLFDLLGNGLQALECSHHLPQLKLLFELKLLKQQGVLHPENEGIYLISTPLRDHATLKVSERDYQNIKEKVQASLNAYLHEI